MEQARLETIKPILNQLNYRGCARFLDIEVNPEIVSSGRLGTGDYGGAV